MRIAASFALALSSAAIPAADWVDIAAPGPVMVQFDAGGVVREGDVVRAWDKAVYPRDQSLGSGDVAYRSVRTLAGYHCVLRTFLPLSRAFFTEDGREIMRTNLEGVELSQPVVPDSPRARMLEQACRKKPEPATPAAQDSATPASAAAAPAAASAQPPRAKPSPAGVQEQAGQAAGAPGPEGKAGKSETQAPAAGTEPPAKADAQAAKTDAPAAAQKGKGSEGDGSARAPQSAAGSAKPGPEKAGKQPAGKDLPPQQPADAKPAQKQADNKARWSYAGRADGPAAWHKLDPEFRLCSEGQRQSPIDIRDSVRLTGAALKLDYRPFTLRIVDNGHTVQVTVPPGSSMTLGGKTYELLQFHFHKPGEERVAGRTYDMAAHFVHKAKDGRMAVLAVLFVPGADHPVIQTIWNNLPLESGRDEEVSGVRVDPAALLPKDRSHYTYMGSLTTPPCTEGVQWVVLKTPVMVSRGQVSIFGKLYAMNARPLQPANGRLIKEAL